MFGKYISEPGSRTLSIVGKLGLQYLVIRDRIPVSQQHITSCGFEEIL